LSSTSRCPLRAVVVLLDAQQRLHAGEQLGAVERFRDEIVGAGLECAKLLLVPHRRDHHDRQRDRARVFAQPSADLVAVHVGHEDVQQDEVDGARADEAERLFARARREHRVALGREHRLQ
jgi:hypothetical protein